MISRSEIMETNEMIEKENLDVRTITMGISLLDCIDSDLEVMCKKIHDKIARLAGKLVETGDEIGREYGIPVVNKRISVTPIGIIGAAACRTEDDFVRVAKELDAVAKEVGVNFLGGFSAVVAKGMTASDELDSQGFGGYGARVQLCQCGFHENRYQHGRRAAHGRDREEDCGAYEGQRFHRLRKACGVLQRTG